MRFELALAALVAFAAAAPIKRGTDGTNGKYISYRPYRSYGPYPAAADAEAATMQMEAHMRRADAILQAHDAYAQDMEMVKRHVMTMMKADEKVEARDGEAAVNKRREASYGKYNPYWYYGRYPMAVDDEAATMDADTTPTTAATRELKQAA